jgi:Ca2+-binding RTX toxin-like protein
MRRLILLGPALALIAALLLAGPALSKVLDGTNGADTLIGTKRNDKITGGEGLDLLKGRDGNDTYFFADNLGQDTLIEKRGQGMDTLDFSDLTSAAVGVLIVREFDQYDIFSLNNGAVLRDPEAGIPSIETVIGGQGAGDNLTTGGGPNTLKPGGGAVDLSNDLGGYDDGTGPDPAIPASNDTYAGFNDNTGTDTIKDWGGTDVVDLRPASSSSVTMTAIDDDGSNGTEESLEITWNFDPAVKVVIRGYFGPYDPDSRGCLKRGHRVRRATIRLLMAR